MNKIVILLLAIAMVSSSNKLVKTKVNDEITVGLPADFFPMTPEDILSCPLGHFQTFPAGQARSALPSKRTR